MSSASLKLSITFHSDWHIGTGGSRFGNVDALVTRDPHTKLPFVPGKTIKGIWRDAAEQLAAALDTAQNNLPSKVMWQDYVDLAFGKASSKDSPTSTSALLRIDAAHFCENDNAFLKGPAGSALTALRPGIKIDSATGTAEVNCLRVEERVAGDCTLSSFVVLDAAEPDKDDYAKETQIALRALLTGASRWIQHLGGNRRRGAGRCVWQLTGDAVLPLALAPLESSPPKITRVAPKTAATLCTNPTQSVLPCQNTQPKFVRLTLQSKTPVVVPLMVAGNVVVGRDELPGTDLLSAFMPYFAADPGIDLRQLIAQGSVRISPGYPAGFQRTPLCLDQLKDGEGPIRNLLVPADAAPTEASGAPTIIAPRKMLRGNFIKLGTGDYRRHRVSKSVRNHSTIDDALQRPTEAVGGVYSYEAISVGQQFSVDIALPAGVQLTTPAAIRLGISKNTDYGKLDVCCVSNQVAPSAGNDSFYLTLVLLSPLLCLGANLQADASLNGLRFALTQSHPALAASLDWGKAQPFIATARFDGWLAKLSMPRPSLVALAAGSAIRLPYKNADTAGAHIFALTQIAIEGLGARRAEGFGWISINPEWATCSVFDMPPDATAGGTGTTASNGTTANATPDQPTNAFQKQIWQRFWQAKITTEAMGKAREFAESLGLTKSLNTSQCSNLVQEAMRMQKWRDRANILIKRRDNWSKTTLDMLAQLGQSDDALAEIELKKFFPALPADDELQLHALRSFLFAAVHEHRHASEQSPAIGAAL